MRGSNRGPALSLQTKRCNYFFMRPTKGEQKTNTSTTKIELDLEAKLVEQLKVMEGYTKISKSELVATALKRFISAHKDYFPDDYVNGV